MKTYCTGYWQLFLGGVKKFQVRSTGTTRHAEFFTPLKVHKDTQQPDSTGNTDSEFFTPLKVHEDLEVTGNTTLIGGVTLEDTLMVNGSGNFYNGLATYGNSSAIFGTNIVGNKSLELNGTSSNLNVNSKFTVAGSTGNTFVGGGARCGG